MLARWDGSRWSRLPLGVQRPITGLSVSSPETISWLTTESGKLFEGTSHGWAERTRFGAPLYDVALWGGDVSLAGAHFGVLRLVPRLTRIEVGASEVEAVALDARGDLLALAISYVAASSDGSSFHVAARDALAGFRSEVAPAWMGPVGIGHSG